MNPEGVGVGGHRRRELGLQPAWHGGRAGRSGSDDRTGLREWAFSAPRSTAGIAAGWIDATKPRGRLQIFVNNMPGKWHAMGVTCLPGSLAMVSGCPGAPKRSFQMDRITSMTSAEACWPNQDRRPVFLPYLTGERCLTRSRGKGAYRPQPSLTRNLWSGVSWKGLFSACGM
jgi:hypothetical protein